VLRDFHVSWSAAAQLLNDFSQAVFKIKGLADLIAQNDSAGLLTRMRAVDMSRSVARAIVIDADGEEFERKQTPINGLPELLELFLTRLAAAADMPRTLLSGDSPGGLNATGESDIRLFYDRVKSAQRTILAPAIKRISTLIMASMGVAEPEDWSIKFHPLWQTSEKEQAETRYIQAQCDEKYINTGVLSAEEVAVNRFGGDEWSGETVIDAKERAALDVAPEPPPTVPVPGNGLPVPGNILPGDNSLAGENSTPANPGAIPAMPQTPDPNAAG
jgi:phage-related protein (TIGR01555 family)